MLIRFFFMLRAAGVPVSVTELLTLHAALQARLIETSVDEFYYLARACLIKDERHYDRYDQVFAAHFNGAEQLFAALLKDVPSDWVQSMMRRMFSDEERAAIESMGGFDALMKALAERLREQTERHHGGNKWIGTGGTSAFGTGGYNPEGISIGQQQRMQGRAVKVWESREYRNLDDNVELGTRNLKLALRKLRRFARTGAADTLDLDGTISATARNAGLLDLHFVPQRHNAIKVLLLLDIGGSMDPHVRVCEELFSAARSEFKHLEYFYFHNCVYETLWRDNGRRNNVRIPTIDVMRTYGHDYKLVLVGDATMSPYEITESGGSVEHWNVEAGAVWIKRLTQTWPHYAWLNPQPESHWEYTPSISLARQLLEDRMFPLTLAGLERAIKALR